MNNFKEEQNLVTHLMEYVQKFFLATKQDVKIDSFNLAGTLIISVLILCISMIFLIVFSICMGLVLEWLLHSYLLSFGILSGVYGVVLLVVFLYRKKLKAKIIQAIIRQTEQ